MGCIACQGNAFAECYTLAACYDVRFESPHSLTRQFQFEAKNEGKNCNHIPETGRFSIESQLKFSTYSKLPSNRVNRRS